MHGVIVLWFNCRCCCSSERPHYSNVERRQILRHQTRHVLLSLVAQSTRSFHPAPHLDRLLPRDDSQLLEALARYAAAHIGRGARAFLRGGVGKCNSQANLWVGHRRFALRLSWTCYRSVLPVHWSPAVVEGRVQQQRSGESAVSTARTSRQTIFRFCSSVRPLLDALLLRHVVLGP